MTQTLQHDVGSAYVITLLVMAITTALAMGLVTAGVSELDISGNYRNRATVYYAADSGIERTIVDLRADFTWIDQVLESGPWALVDPFPSTVTIDGTALVLPTDAGGEVIPGYVDLGNSQSAGYGSFTRQIWMPPTLSMSGTDPVVTFRTRSIGSGGTGDQAMQVVRADVGTQLSAHGVWDNAIFADSGAGGGTINGHVAVRGSVHVIGDESSPPTIEFGGSADIHNHYGDAVDWFGATDAGKLPALPTVVVNGVNVETLETVIRAQHADISLTGSAYIGEVNDDSNGTKETIDGIRADGTVGPSSEVHSDYWGAYDTDQVEFPTLADPYVDPATGTAWSTHQDFLDANSLTITEAEISESIAAFSHSDANGNSISWDPSTLALDISGIVRVDGSLRLGQPHGQPGLRGVKYDGTGTIYATNDMHIDGFVVPSGNYIADGNLGLIAADDVLIDEATHVSVFAAIYGQDEISVTKQTAVAGALVSTTFDLGTNVPGVFHVPSLSTNLPPGMPGASRVVSIERVEVTNWFQESGP